MPNPFSSITILNLKQSLLHVKAVNDQTGVVSDTSSECRLPLALMVIFFMLLLYSALSDMCHDFPLFAELYCLWSWDDKSNFLCGINTV